MQRRSLLGLAGLILAPGVGAQTPETPTAPVPRTPNILPKGATLTLRWLGHTSFLFTSREARILVNPFRPIPCTQGYQKPAVPADLVLMSSRLFDEGAIDVVPGNPKVLLQPGVYDVEGLKIEGIRTFHDEREGKRFGVNVVWRWKQGGLNLVHLGGLAVPLTDEQKILIGQTDILFVPVGGGVKAMNTEKAIATVRDIAPRMVIPTHYRTGAALNSCDLTGVEDFLKAFPPETVKTYPGTTISLAANQLAKGPQVRVFTYTNFVREILRGDKASDVDFV